MPGASAEEKQRAQQAMESLRTQLRPEQIVSFLREGRLRAARSIYDFDLFGSLKNNLDGFYEYSVVEAGAQQFLGLWGSTVYGGYRLSTGELLPPATASGKRKERLVSNQKPSSSARTTQGCTTSVWVTSAER